MSVDRLYHYCSFDTFLEIVRTRKMRFSDLNGLRDLDGLTLVYRKYGKRNGAGRYGCPDLFSVPDVRRALDGSIYFVFPFTSDEDSAHMWERYADHGQGVSLEFDVAALESWMVGITLGTVETDADRSFDFKKSGPRRVEYGPLSGMFYRFRTSAFTAEDDAPFMKRGPSEKKNEYRAAITASARAKGRMTESVASACDVTVCCGDMDNTARIVFDEDGNLLPTIEVPFNLNMIRSIRIGPKCRERKNEIMALMAFSFDRVAEDGLNGHASEPSHYLGEVLMSGEKHEDGWWDNTT